ncbi:hypothetical protein B0T13DRAFT_459512 [Neurospora crassa]|nr:hypothetical protein B0T13DRAFT_459512 [Neurospora crassa]
MCALRQYYNFSNVDFHYNGGNRLFWLPITNCLEHLDEIEHAHSIPRSVRVTRGSPSKRTYKVYTGICLIFVFFLNGGFFRSNSKLKPPPENLPHMHRYHSRWCKQCRSPPTWPFYNRLWYCYVNIHAFTGSTRHYGRLIHTLLCKMCCY